MSVFLWVRMNKYDRAIVFSLINSVSVEQEDSGFFSREAGGFKKPEVEPQSDSLRYISES